jgi:chromatin remodeling complex protein RSC6
MKVLFTGYSRTQFLVVVNSCVIISCSKKMNNLPREDQQPALEVPQPPLEVPQQMVNPVPKPKKRRKRYRARRHFNRNHIIKSKKYGTRREAGFKRLRKRWRWQRNRGHRVLAREVRVTPEMSAIIGRERASWPQMTRLIWVYIKEHKLQNPENGRLFKPDQQLARVMGTEGEYMDGFTMMKSVKRHVLPN